MRKSMLLGLALMASMSLSAQTSVLKDVEHNLKSSNPNPAQALKDIQPALTNPETAKLADTWVLAGKAGFDVYQNMVTMQAIGQNPDNGQKSAGAQALLDGYNYFLTALPLDTVVNEKGKVKTKFSKEIIKKINEKYQQLPQAAVFAWEAADYQKSYDLFDMFLSLPTNPVLGKNAPQADPDSIRGNMLWNQGIAMLLLNKPAEALVKLRQMEGLGYEPDEYYEYAVSAAQQAGDDEAAVEFAQKGIAKYGASNTAFIATLINEQLNRKDYKAAYKLANDAIAQTSADEAELRSQLYDILGTIAENDNNETEAEVHFRKSVEVDPNYAKGWYDLGRIIHNRAIAVDNNIESEAQRVEQVYPLEREAAGYFEKAYNIDENQSNIPGILYRIYYMLGDDDKANYWQNM